MIWQQNMIISYDTLHSYARLIFAISLYQIVSYDTLHQQYGHCLPCHNRL